MQNNDDLKQKPHEIRSQMVETREALMNKAEAFEDAVRDKLGQAKEVLQDKIKDVQRNFTLTHQVEERPWRAMVAAVSVGLALQKLVGHTANKAQENTDTFSKYGAGPRTPYVKSIQLQHQQPAQAAETTIGRITSEFNDEIRQSKNLAIASGIGLFREFAKRSLPLALGAHITDLARRAQTRLTPKPSVGSEPFRTVNL